MKYNNLEIKKIRKELGKTQTELGKMLGVGIRIIQRWEKGEREISNSADMLLKNYVNDLAPQQPATPPIVKKAVSTNAEDIGKRIKQLMLEFNLNYRQLAEITNYSDVAIGKIVNGKNKPKFSFLSSILLSIENVDARWLLTGQGSMDNRFEIVVVKNLEDFHPLEIVDYIDSRRDRFINLSLFKKLVASFVNQGFVDELTDEIFTTENGRKKYTK